MPALLLLVALTVLQAPDWVTVIKPAFKQVVRLEMLQEGSDDPGTCSGVVFNKELGYLLTAGHCVNKPQDKSLSITANKRHADLIKINTLLDLAILKTQLRGEEQIAFAEKTPEPGSPVAVVGYAFGWEEIHPTFGFVSNSNAKSAKLNSDIIAGDSGGAVIDAQGKLIAINSALNFWYSSGLAIGVPIETVREFAEPYLPKPKTP